MSKEDGLLPPQVIRRGDDYVVLNVDLDQLNRNQRVGLGVQIFDQLSELMQANGERVWARDVSEQAAKAVNAAYSAIYTARLAVLRKPDLLPRMLTGEMNVTDVMREANYRVQIRLDEGRPTTAKLSSSYYGKGDKFEAAIEPLRRYLKAWKKRDFEFRHVNPAEAKRRVRRIDEAISQLQEAREDLVKRSHVATLRAPSEKRKGKGKK